MAFDVALQVLRCEGELFPHLDVQQRGHPCPSDIEAWVSGAGCTAAFTYLLHVCTVCRKGLEASVCCLLTVIYTSVRLGRVTLLGGRLHCCFGMPHFNVCGVRVVFCAGH